MNKHFRKILTGFTLIVILTNVFAINLQSKSNFADKSELETKSEDYDLLIISPSEFIKSLEPLVCHKNKHDIQTKLVDTD